MVTLKQIAQVCGVSTASVSKALNHATDIGEETAERIRRTARELGYYPNSAARALKTNRTYNIGVLFEDDTHVGLTHEYFIHMLNAVKNAAESRGYDITFISKHVSPTRSSYLEHCLYRNVDGVVIANVDFNDASVQELIASPIPVVTVDYVYDGHSAVLSDNVSAMHDLVSFVYGMGHRQIAAIFGQDTAVTRSRMAGFYRACKELNLTVPEDHVISGFYHDPKDSGRATRALLSGKNPPTCIFYPDDISLLGGMTEIEKQGLKVPDDLSVVGFDGIPLSRVLRPVVTTLRQNSETIGTKAAQLLIEAIEEPKVYAPHIVSVPGEVQTGGTVARI